MTEALIRSLPIWKNEIQIAPLEGGLTNWNCKVTDGDSAYAVRTGEDDPRLGISRSNELRCAQIAAELGVAPRLAYAGRGVLVTEFIASVPLAIQAGTQAGKRAIERVAAMVRRIHAAGPNVVGALQYFSPFQVAHTYIADARDHGLALPGDGADQLLSQVQKLEESIAPFQPTFCHNDLMPGNLLDDGNRLWVIDWEYSGIGHGMFDLGGLSNNYSFHEDQDEALLEAYFQGLPRDVGEFRVMKAMAALRESLWAVVHGSKSEIDFDYDGYRDENYQKFCRALATTR
jgi:thiamine kinase-like enzyme